MSRAGRWMSLAVLAASFLFCAFSSQAQAPKPDDSNLTWRGRLAKKWKLKESEVNTRLADLAEEIKKELTSGRTIELPQVGTLRVVRVLGYRDRDANGKLATVPESNGVQILPAGGLLTAVNGPGARPTDKVLPTEYFQVPPPIRSDDTRNKGTRVPTQRIK